MVVGYRLSRPMPAMDPRGHNREGRAPSPEYLFIQPENTELRFFKDTTYNAVPIRERHQNHLPPLVARTDSLSVDCGGSLELRVKRAKEDPDFSLG